MTTTKIEQLKTLADQAGLKSVTRTYNGGIILNIITDNEGRGVGIEATFEGKSVRHHSFIEFHGFSKIVSFANIVGILTAKVGA
jgi:hypothetical protein